MQGYKRETTFNDLVWPDYYLKSLTLSTYNNTIKACRTNLTNALVCDDTDECGSTDNTGPVCCSGNGSCKQSDTMTAILDFLTYPKNNIYRTSIRCDSYWGAYDYYQDWIAPIGGDIYFSAYYSEGPSFDTTLDSNAVTSTSSSYDIICSGYFSCSQRPVDTCYNLYCTGQSSCSRLNSITNVYNNIYATGGNALSGVDVYNVVGDIYCGGSNGCNSANIQGPVGGNIFGRGFQVLNQATIMNIGENVVGIGYRVLYGTEIKNVGESVVAAGYEALASANVTDTPQVPYLYIKIYCTQRFF